jgi:hypothetical protein
LSWPRILFQGGQGGLRSGGTAVEEIDGLCGAIDVCAREAASATDWLSCRSGVNRGRIDLKGLGVKPGVLQPSGHDDLLLRRFICGVAGAGSAARLQPRIEERQSELVGVQPVGSLRGLGSALAICDILLILCDGGIGRGDLVTNISARDTWSIERRRSASSEPREEHGKPDDHEERESRCSRNLLVHGVTLHQFLAERRMANRFNLVVLNARV